MTEKYFAFVTQVMLTIFIPGLPLMVILGLQNHPNRWFLDWLQSHRRPVLIAYAAIIAVSLSLSGFALSPDQIWTFIKYATVPTLIGTGIVMYPWTGRDAK